MMVDPSFPLRTDSAQCHLALPAFFAFRICRMTANPPHMRFLRAYERQRLLRDHQFFVGGDYPDRYAAIRGGMRGPPAAFARWSSFTPSHAILLHSAARTGTECSPMPAVKTKASTPPSTAA